MALSSMDTVPPAQEVSMEARSGAPRVVELNQGAPDEVVGRLLLSDFEVH